MSAKNLLFFLVLSISSFSKAQNENDTVKIIKHVYVINRDGADALQEPAEGSEQVEHYEFGTILSVTDTVGEWLKVQRLHWVDAEDVYVRKWETGQDADVVLDSTELNYTGEEYTDIDGDGNPLPNDYIIKVEAVSKEEYLKKQKKSVDYFTPDTTIPKIGGNTTLPTKGLPITLTDNDVDNETVVVYDYIGQIKPLNAYLVFIRYWEDYGLNMYNKSTGALVYSGIGVPMLSPDKKLLVSLTAGLYESVAEFTVATVDKDSITSGLYCSYKYWMPAGDAFWSKDGCLYSAMLPSIVNWNLDGSPNTNYRYIRMKIEKMKKKK